MDVKDETVNSLARDIADSSPDKIVETTLRTNDRVLGRITDGIYRRPQSAFRELISNAYDADATRVIITTDRPRFARIVIEDDGQGMTPRTIAYLVHNIGGSAKRTAAGADLGLASRTDPRFSPGGRRLIGKIGIGLFSVAQMTNTFQIITKRRGDRFRTVASVIMKQYSDELDETTTTGDDDQEGAASRDGDFYEAGKVKLWTESATDEGSHGTTVVLTKIRPQTVEALRGEGMWQQLRARDEQAVDDETFRINTDPGVYHVGAMASEDQLYSRDDGQYTNLPWVRDDPPDRAFRQLVAAVKRSAESGRSNARLEQLLDAYLRMVWDVALSIPAPYVEKHPFDLGIADQLHVFRIPEDSSLPMEPIELDADHPTIREALELGGTATASDDFVVQIDDLELARPISFTDMPHSKHAVDRPMIFVGEVSVPFDSFPVELSGGPLEFQAYLTWTPKVVPIDHAGAMIRINGASGTLFDSSFLDYRTSELTRLRQTTCEIFVSRGLEGALNIDRESFNYAHPHVAYLTRWLHAALRRLATAQKRVAKQIRVERRHHEQLERESTLDRISAETWHRARDEDEEPPTVRIATPAEARSPDLDDGADQGVIVVRRRWQKPAGAQRQVAERRERQVEAVIKVLAAYDLLQYLDSDAIDELAASLIRVLEVSE